MPKRIRSSSLLRSTVAFGLGLQMLLPVGLIAQMQTQAGGAMGSAGEPMAAVAKPPAGPRTPLTQDERVLHLLNRFTYGPRPGDLERVKAMGISAWVGQQMSPQKIDDSALDARLADFPAMAMSLDRMMAAYPTNATIRQMSDGKMSNAPGGEAEHAIYAAQMERYEDKKKADGTDKARAAKDSDVPAMDPEKVRAILALPPDQRFLAVCRMSPAGLRSLRQGLRGADREKLTADFTPRQMEEFAAIQNPQAVVAAETLDTKLLRDIYTERQLNEVMVDFWLNHFNVYIKKSQQAPYYIEEYEKEAIRPRALGSFEELLKATAMSPAMLNYLDNSESVGPRSQFANKVLNRAQQAKKARPSGLNENYARELMELHTLGVGGGYTQKDVTEVAKVFTGWTVGGKTDAFNRVNGRNALGAAQAVDEPSQAEFDASKHEPGSKTVLGVTIKEAGEREGLEVLHMLATSPATARFIAKKLAVRFVSDEPPQALVDRMAAKFTETNGNIRQVLVTMINSPEFWTRETYRGKVKTPQDFVISAVRASGAEVGSPSALVATIADLGMPLYGMQTPNGYSMRADPWNNSGALVSRMNFALALSVNKVPGVVTNWPAIVGAGDEAAGPAAKDAVLEDKLLHVRVSDRTRQTILAQIGTDAEQQEASLQQIAGKGKRDPFALHTPNKAAAGDLDAQSALAAGLLFGSPEFQRR
jgi:uncharacterized protein (DUF1800 family)